LTAKVPSGLQQNQNQQQQQQQAVVVAVAAKDAWQRGWGWETFSGPCQSTAPWCRTST
jgi:hypothetical protein